MAPRTTDSRLSAAIAAALFAVVGIVYLTWHPGNGAKPGPGATNGASNAAIHNADSVDLSDSQLAAVKVQPVEERDFPVEKEAVGSIDFNEDMAVQVFTPYQGRIIALFAEVGDDVKKGQTLFTIDSPDLLQAESTLIAAVGVMDLDHPQSGASARALHDARRIAARSGSGGLRPA